MTTHKKAHPTPEAKKPHKAAKKLSAHEAKKPPVTKKYKAKNTELKVAKTPNSDSPTKKTTPPQSLILTWNLLKWLILRKKYDVISPDSLQFDTLSFGESFKRYESTVPSEFHATTKHSIKHDRVHEGLLRELVTHIMTSCPWLSDLLKKMVTAADGTHVVPAVIIELGGDINLQKRRMALAVLFGWLSLKKPKKTSILPDLQPTPIMTYLWTLLGKCKDLFDWRFQLNCDFNFAGGLITNLNKLFQHHQQQHGVLYGAASNR